MTTVWHGGASRRWGLVLALLGAMPLWSAATAAAFEAPAPETKGLGDLPDSFRGEVDIYLDTKIVLGTNPSPVMMPGMMPPGTTDGTVLRGVRILGVREILGRKMIHLACPMSLKGQGARNPTIVFPGGPGGVVPEARVIDGNRAKDDKPKEDKPKEDKPKEFELLLDPARILAISTSK